MGKPAYVQATEDFIYLQSYIVPQSLSSTSNLLTWGDAIPVPARSGKKATYLPALGLRL